MMEAMAPYAENEDGQSMVRKGALRSLDARSVMLDGLYKAVFKDSVPVLDASVRVGGQ
jgi:pyrroloquinoline-quinone synthase